jgi:hypothetical protein
VFKQTGDDSIVPHTPESWWEIQVAGDSHTLEFLGAVLAVGEIRFVSEDGRNLLRIPELDRIRDVGVVRSRARSYAASLSGAAKLALGSDSPLQVGNILRRHLDGRADHFLEIEPARLEMRGFPAALGITRRDGTVENRDPGRELRSWLEVAGASGPARRVLRLIGEPDLSWVELYRVVEIIQKVAKAPVSIWVSKDDLGRFKHTANSVGAVGDQARHGHERTEPPKDPMALDEANKLVSDLARNWLSFISDA